MTTLNQTKDKLDKTIEYLVSGLSKLQTNQVSPSLLENIEIDAYDTKTALSQLASITNQGPRTIVVQPWDQGVLKEVEKAIRNSDLGISPAVDGNMVRINFPPLTEEKRKEIVKILNEKLEESRVRIRKTREEHLKGLKEAEKEGEVSEDEYFKEEKDLQTEIDNYNNKIKEIGQKKEEEIMTV